MDFLTIKHQLKNLYSNILIDKIINSEDTKNLICLKNISYNEPYFQNTIDPIPFLPESAILEIIKQASTILLLKQHHLSATKLYFESIESLSFYKQATPGDQLRIECEIQKKSHHNATIQALVLIDGQKVCIGKLIFQLSEAPSRPQIHPTASVHPSAILGKNVVVGPYTIVGENVIIGKNTILEAHSLIDRWTKIGEDCHIHFGCVIGSNPQDKKYKNEKTWVVLGDRNILREYVTINRGTGANAITKIGSDNLLLTGSHIGHNCVLGNNIVITNNSQIAGHVNIEDFAIIGGLVGIHQNCRIGTASMIGGYSRISQDIPPYTLCEGTPATVKALNLIGLKRSKKPTKTIEELKNIFKIYFRSNLNASQALEKISLNPPISPEGIQLYEFLKTPSSRGITKRNQKDE